ncbi:MAG: PH domain-containing protein [Actinobacteria bacterium]|nr:PH domain-containing protein [Actinomycetota bacterium]
MGVSGAASVPWARTPMLGEVGENSEHSIAEVRRHELGLLGLGVRIVIAAALFGMSWAALQTWQPGGEVASTIIGWALLVGFVLYLLLGLCRRFLSWANARTVITNQRVVVRYRLRRPGWEIPLISIADVTLSRGPMERLFGVGTLRIQTTFAPNPAVIDDVADVATVRHELLQLRDQAWSRHGAHIAGRYTPMHGAS